MSNITKKKEVQKAVIPLSIPEISGNEWKYVKDCLDTGWVSMAGAYVTQFEQTVAIFAQTKYGVAAVNGTCGLHMALNLLDIKLNDYVIVPNITFIASANAVAYTGADPLFIDIDPDTWQLDLDLLETFLNEQTEIIENKLFHKSTKRPIKGIMPVHVLGNMCDMDKLMELCTTHHLHVVEDASESLGSYFNGKHSGSFGDINVFSFNGNKIITTGGGGVIVTNNEEYAKRAKHLTTQAKTDPETYFHDEIGYNYRMVNVLAAIGVAQMEQLPSFIKKKKVIDEYYREQLKDVGDIQFQKITKGVDPNCWLFTFRSNKQTELLAALKENKIIARPFWTPMNQLPMFTDNIYISSKNHSKDIHLSSLSIPSSVNLTHEDQDRVIQVIKSVFN